MHHQIFTDGNTAWREHLRQRREHERRTPERTTIHEGSQKTLQYSTVAREEATKRIEHSGVI